MSTRGRSDATISPLILSKKPSEKEVQVDKVFIENLMKEGGKGGRIEPLINSFSKISDKIKNNIRKGLPVITKIEIELLFHAMGANQTMLARAQKKEDIEYYETNIYHIMQVLNNLMSLKLFEGTTYKFSDRNEAILNGLKFFNQYTKDPWKSDSKSLIKKLEEQQVGVGPRAGQKK